MLNDFYCQNVAQERLDQLTAGQLVQSTMESRLQLSMNELTVALATLEQSQSALLLSQSECARLSQELAQLKVDLTKRDVIEQSMLSRLTEYVLLSVLAVRVDLEPFETHTAFCCSLDAQFQCQLSIAGEAMGARDHVCSPRLIAARYAAPVNHG